MSEAPLTLPRMLPVVRAQRWPSPQCELQLSGRRCTVPGELRWQMLLNAAPGMLPLSAVLDPRAVREAAIRTRLQEELTRSFDYSFLNARLRTSLTERQQSRLEKVLIRLGTWLCGKR